jgi:cytochrome c-type biogenesis protein CcmH
MTFVFWSVAGAMALVALVLVLRPLVRGGARDARLDALERARRDGVLSDAEFEAKRVALGPQASAPAPVSFPMIGVFALVFVAAAVLLYRGVGEPRGLDPAAAASAPVDAPALEDATTKLAERLAKDPDDAEGWLLLGRAYKTMQRFPEARDALANANRLAPDEPDTMVEYAESLALASADRRLAGEALALLDKALAADPAHQRGLWLRGIAMLQDERYGDAVAVWEKLLQQLPPGSDVHQSVVEQIAQARARAGMPAMAERTDASPAATAAAAPASPPAPSSDGAAVTRLVVEIELAPELESRISPGDTLFVFARAPQGPKMPLAIQRIPVPEFPTTIVLDDSMGMMPALKLSQAAEVVVGARVSKSGNAAPQSGDLEIISAPLAVATQRSPVKLVIDRIVQ